LKCSKSSTISKTLMKKSYLIDLQQQICVDMILRLFQEAVLQTLFSDQVINNWNSLQQQVVDSNSLNVFMKRLDHHMDTLDREYMGNKS